MFGASGLFRLAACSALTVGLSSHAQAADPIKVGVVTPLSGTYAQIGKQVRWGAELAVKEINAAGGVKGRMFELLFEDEEANPPVAVRKAEKLLQQDKVDLLTGTVNSGSTLAVGQLAERNDRILVTTVSYAPSITGAQCNPNVFRVNANAFMQSNALTNWLIKNVSGKRYFFIGPDYEMGRSTIGCVPGRHQAARRHRRRFHLSAARRQGLHAIYRTDPRRAARRDHDRDRRQRHRAAAHAAQGIRHPHRQADAGRRGRRRDAGKHRRHGRRRRGLPERGRLLDRHRHAGEQEVRRGIQEGIPDRIRTCSARTPTACSICSSRRSRRQAATDTAKVRAAMEDASWETPQGIKKMRKGDHQAIVDMVVVKVKGNDFQTVGKVPGAEAVGPDKCEKF